jgi:hypothetical protein
METLDILAGAKKSGDSRTTLLAIQRAEAQLRLAGELVGQLGQLRAKVDVNVRVIRSLADLRNDELDAILQEAEVLLPPEEQVKLLAPPLKPQ